MTPLLGGWLSGLKSRHHQLYNWYNGGRPPSFWLTGFFNPQGFLTAMKQEVTRLQKGAWSLDDVDYKSEPRNEIIDTSGGVINKNITPPTEGVLIHGLYLEGAGWDKKGGRLE